MSNLNGKVAVITGGNSGIGLATAQEFKAQGAKVVIFGRSAETLEAAYSALTNGGATNGVLTVQGDVTNPANLERLFAETAARFGGVDALFINAGIARIAPIEAVTEADFDQVMTINFKAAFFTIQKALPHLNDNASIVLNTSINATIGMPMTSVYAASKAALNSLVRTLSAELVGRGIRVNAVSPGPVQTPLYGRLGLSQEQLQGFAQSVQSQIPLGRFGQPQEIAKAVVFLASSDSSFVVGTELVADGGMSQL